MFYCFLLTSLIFQYVNNQYVTFNTLILILNTPQFNFFILP